MEPRDGENYCGYVVAEAILAGKDVEELALQVGLGILALGFAKLTWFAKDGFVRERPGDTRDWNSEKK